MKPFHLMSKLYAPTLKEDPAEAELASHRLLLRAGMIRKTASGLYSYLPLAWRSLLKIEAIIRDEMDAIDAQEMLLPVLTPAELWRESGRWDVYGPELMRMSDRHEREFALGPTHEETMVDLVRGELKSYRDLPCCLYQIQVKFRDEMRPRFGLMRGREFIMKDGYSFHATQESLQETYDAMKEAYAKICERAGLTALPVVADSGQIGGDTSVEFMALAEAGEAALVWCDCGFAADEEAATAGIEVHAGVDVREPLRIETPGATTIAQVAKALEVPENGVVKALALVDGEGRAVCAFVPGDHDLNEIKATRAFGAYHLMSDEELEAAGLIKGFIGPMGLPEGVAVVADLSLKGALTWTAGANERDYHIAGIQPARDFTVDAWEDLANAQEGDLCPVCGRPLHAARGIEVSQVFQLGTKYSTALHATYTSENGQEEPFIMGCYGIGVSRMLAAVVEQHHDEKGIVWPASVAPYAVHIIPLDVDDELVYPEALAIAEALAERGIECLIDDRQERPGVKFNDADLMGMPVQVICGKRAIAQGKCEVKVRATGERLEFDLAEVAEQVAKLAN
jgi:prolyl-tRNA synthetase